MSNSHFSKYVSPNIVIVPTISFCGPPRKRQKLDAICQPATQTIPVFPVPVAANDNNPCATMLPMKNIPDVKCQPMTQALHVPPIDIQVLPVLPVENTNCTYVNMFPVENKADATMFPIQNNTNDLQIQDNLSNQSCPESASSNNFEDSEQRVKKTLSWASNFLQSIGQSQPKATKLTNLPHQKLIPKVEENRQELPYKNLFKPTFRNLDVAQIYPNSLQQSSYTEVKRQLTQMKLNSTTNDNMNSHDTKHPIKINILYNKRNIDKPYIEKANNQNTIHNIKTPNYEKSITEIRAEGISTHITSKDSEKDIKDTKTQYFEKNFIEKRTDCISNTLPSKSGENNMKNKGKTDKAKIKSNPTSTINKNISVKSYADRKDGNKDSKERNFSTRTKSDPYKSSCKWVYKTKDRLDAWRSNKLKSHLKKPFHSLGKSELEARASNKIKTNYENSGRFHSNRSPLKSSKTDSIKDKCCSNIDHKNKPKSSMKSNNDDYKNNTKRTMKSNENYSVKTSELQNSTPVKSVVQVTNKYDVDNHFKTKPKNVEDLRTKINVPENSHNITDLRTKLKRKYQNSETTKRDNLIITVQNENEDIVKQQTAEEKPKLEKKTRKYKKIELVINVICENYSESSESDSDTKHNEENPLANVDLSFLDDFNIDDIVDSLNDQEDKANVNKSPPRTMDSKNITEKLVGKHIKNEDSKKINSLNLQNRSHTELPEVKMDLKQIIDAQEVIEDDLKNNKDEKYWSADKTGTSNNVQNKIKNIQFLEDSKPALMTEKSNKLFISPINKSENNYNNDTNSPFNLNLTSDITNNCSTQLIPTTKKVYNAQNNTSDLIDSKLQKENDTGNVNKTSETEKQIEANDLITIDLTQIETETSTNSEIVNIQSSKQTAVKQHKSKEISAIKDLIDLTVSSEITSSIINTSSEQQIKIKGTSTKYDIKAQSREKISQIKSKANEKIQKIEIQPQLNDTNKAVTSTNSDIIDLTLSTAITTGKNNAAIKSSTAKEHLEKNNIGALPAEITTNLKNNTKVNSAKNYNNAHITAPRLQQHKANKTLSNNAEIKTSTKVMAMGNERKVQKTQIALEPKQQDDNETTSNNSKLENNTQETSPRPQQHRIGDTSSSKARTENVTAVKASEKAVVSVQKTEIAPRSQQHEVKKALDKSIAYIQKPGLQQHKDKKALEKAIATIQITEIAPGLQQHEDKKALEKAIVSIQKPEIISGLQQQEAKKALEKAIASIQNTEIASELQQYQDKRAFEKAVVGVEKTEIAPVQQHEAKKPSPNYEMNEQKTDIVSQTQNSLIKKSWSLACQQNNSKCTNKQVGTAIEKSVNDDCEDVLNIAANGLDKNLTSYNSEISDLDKTRINSPTCSKSLAIFNKKEEVATITTKIMKSVTEIKKSTTESKVTESKKDGKTHIDSNKDKCDSAVNVKLNWKHTEQVAVVENRMMEYFGAPYSIESLISQGKFSKIYLCKDKNNRNYALKVLNKGKRGRGYRIEDMLIDVQKDIPKTNYHCVYFVDGFALSGQCCFLMDYYPKNMQEVLYENKKCFHIDVVHTLARQLVAAVVILRNNNIMHLNIKPSHVLMNSSNDRLKLTGFDESQYLEELSVLPCVGTVNYRPPEVILGFPYFAKIDVWSTALVIYEMCTARQLFPGQHNNDILYKQMCTLGNIPYEMVFQSVFANSHYRGTSFAKRNGPAWKNCVLIHGFKRSMRLATSLFEAYHRDWAKIRNKQQKANDSAKLRRLRELLEEMLVLDPSRRTPIEFVYANSFIYETFN